MQKMRTYLKREITKILIIIGYTCFIFIKEHSRFFSVMIFTRISQFSSCYRKKLNKMQRSLYVISKSRLLHLLHALNHNLLLILCVLCVKIDGGAAAVSILYMEVS